MEYCEKRRTTHPPIYNETRLKEYFSDLNTIGFNATENREDIRMDQLVQLVKTLNEKLGTEDLTIEDNVQGEEHQVEEGEEEEEVGEEEEEEGNMNNVENSDENTEGDCPDIVFGKNKYKTNVR